MLRISVDSVHPDAQDPAAGWNITQFRRVFSDRNGTSATLFHGTFLPGSQHSIHHHANSDELSIYLRGKALAGAGSDRLTIEPGYVRVMPAGVPHFFHNISADEPAELIGIYPNASSVENTGYVYHGVPTDADFAECAAQEAAGRRFPVARVDAAAAYEAAGKLGWSGTDYRELLSAPTGNGAFAFMAKLAVGGGRQPHRLANADSFYFIQSGQATGSANGSAFASQARDAWYTPRGEVLQFENASPHEPLVMYGFHIGAQTSLDLGCLVSDGP